MDSSSDHDLLVETAAEVRNIGKQVGDVRQDIKDLDNKFVTKPEFGPVQKIVYGMVGAVMLAVLVGLLALIIK